MHECMYKPSVLVVAAYKYVIQVKHIINDACHLQANTATLLKHKLIDPQGSMTYHFSIDSQNPIKH